MAKVGQTTEWLGLTASALTPDFLSPAPAASRLRTRWDVQISERLPEEPKAFENSRGHVNQLTGCGELPVLAVAIGPT